MAWKFGKIRDFQNIGNLARIGNEAWMNFHHPYVGKFAGYRIEIRIIRYGARLISYRQICQRPNVVQSKYNDHLCVLDLFRREEKCPYVCAPTSQKKETKITGYLENLVKCSSGLFSKSQCDEDQRQMTILAYQGVAHENRGRKIGNMGSQKQERKQSIMC